MERLVRERTEDLRKENDALLRENAQLKLMAGAFREKEGRYRSLFEHMLNGFAYCRMLYDAHGNPEDFIYLAVNSAFERLTGLEDVVGKRATEAIPGIKEAHPQLFEIYDRVARTGKPERFEIELEPLAEWLSISAYSTEQGYFTAVFDNITERKLEGMRMAWLASFPERNLNPIVEIDADGHVQYSNPAADRLFPDLKREGVHHPYLVALETNLAEQRQGVLTSTLRDVRVGERWYEQAYHYLADLQRVRIYGVTSPSADGRKSLSRCPSKDSA